MDDPFRVVSIIGLVGFGLLGIWRLYKAWQFMSHIGVRPHHHGTKRDRRTERHLRKQFEKLSNERDSQHETGGSEALFAGRDENYVYHFFHVHISNVVYGVAGVLLAVYYLLQFVNILWFQRASDLELVNPYRWWLLQPLVGLVVGLVSSTFVNHYLPDLLVVGFLSTVGRALLGFALILPIGSSSFWLVYAIGAALSLLSVLFLWGRESTRTSRTVAVLYMFLMTVAVFVVFALDSSVFGILSFTVTTILYLVIDALMMLPSIIIPLSWYYKKYGTPFLPLMVYQAYGLGHLWTLQTSTELHELWPMHFLTYEVGSKHHRHHGKRRGSSHKQGTMNYTKTELVYSKCNICGQHMEHDAGHTDDAGNAAVDVTSASDMVYSANKVHKHRDCERQNPEDKSSSSSDSDDSSSSEEERRQKKATKKKSSTVETV